MKKYQRWWYIRSQLQNFLGHIEIYQQMLESLFIDADSKVQGANMGPTWVLSATDGPRVDDINLGIRGANKYNVMPYAEMEAIWRAISWMEILWMT